MISYHCIFSLETSQYLLRLSQNDLSREKVKLLVLFDLLLGQKLPNMLQQEHEKPQL